MILVFNRQWGFYQKCNWPNPWRLVAPLPSCLEHNTSPNLHSLFLQCYHHSAQTTSESECNVINIMLYVTHHNSRHRYLLLWPVTYFNLVLLWQVSILSSYEVCLEFLKNKEGQDRVMEVFRISQDGIHVCTHYKTIFWVICVGEI